MVLLLDKPQKISVKGKHIDRLYWGDLDGRTWTKWSISLWDIVKSAEERGLGHPAMFPSELCERLIRVYTRMGDVVLDPFMGSGTTLVAAKKLFRKGIGFEIYDYFVQVAKQRLEKNYPVPLEFFKEDVRKLLSEIDYEPVIVKDDARNLDKYLDEGTVDLVLTSPPYFNVHRRERTSDRKEKRPYGEDPKDLGNIEDYDEFMDELAKIFKKIYKVLKKGGINIVIIMDIREKGTFYPFHIDLANKLTNIGFKLRDIIIWDRRKEYNNIRPIGYPNKFIINKVHEYIMIFER